jgi:hypothetical protein
LYRDVFNSNIVITDCFFHVIQTSDISTCVEMALYLKA